VRRQLYGVACRTVLRASHRTLPRCARSGGALRRTKQYRLSVGDPISPGER